MNFVREHPYLTGGAVLALIVLFLVVRRSSGGGTQVVSTGPSEALQAAGLAAQVQLNQAQTAASLHLSDLNAAVAAHERDSQLQLAVAGIQKDVALSSILTNGQVDMSKVDAATFIAQTQAKAQTDQTQAVVSGQVAVTGIQAGVQQHQFDVALAAQKDIDATTLQTTSLTESGATDRAKIGADAATTIATTQAGRDVAVAGIAGSTATTLSAQEAQRQIDLANIAAPIYVHGIDTQAAIYNNIVNSSTQLQSQKIGAQSVIDDQVLQLIRSGQINKGGEGGLNQVGALSLIFGAPGVAVATSTSQTPDTAGTTAAGVGKAASGFAGFLNTAFSFFGL